VRRRALGDITNNNAGKGTKGKRGLSNKQKKSSLLKEQKAAVKSMVDEFDLDDLLEGVEEVELVHGSSEVAPFDSGLDIDLVKKARKKMQKSEETEKERDQIDLDDPELNGELWRLFFFQTCVD
jgi:hypothetical protein